MYKRILIATDGSDLAGLAVQHGVSLAKALEASVVIVTVTENWPAFEAQASLERGEDAMLEEFEAAALGSAEQVLARAKDAAAEQGVKATVRHIRGRNAADGILQTADLEDCDLIVMASRGHKGLQKLLIGSQTSEVLTKGKKPVLVVR